MPRKNQRQSKERRMSWILYLEYLKRRENLPIRPPCCQFDLNMHLLYLRV
jgi:hypothetical protein